MLYRITNVSFKSPFPTKRFSSLFFRTTNCGDETDVFLRKNCQTQKQKIKMKNKTKKINKSKRLQQN